MARPVRGADATSPPPSAFPAPESAGLAAGSAWWRVWVAVTGPPHWDDGHHDLLLQTIETAPAAPTTPRL
ncbi:hypothetical protein GCM10022214_15470 [Actinomadura miaoliensis]|uniref:Uncharacterized protein n=1 Tax=Actinomadura miaoliensis TaxID=430685 RepID=A0ABP7VAA3_9ACTN